MARSHTCALNRSGTGWRTPCVRPAQSWPATNKLEGVVLDLRYAAGDDYASAAATAELFIKKEQPLLDWGTGMVRSKDKSDAISVPVAVLVNRADRWRGGGPGCRSA